MAYIVGITIVSLVDKKLSNISINLPKQDIILDLKNFNQEKTIKPDEEEGYTNYIPAPIEDICYENHQHTKCKYGKTNYPDPSSMTPIDKRYFKYNYPQNLTIQDYINWLYLYKTNPEDLPYNHLRNLKILLDGGKLEYQPGITPPPSYINLPLNSSEYFGKLYNEELDITRPLGTDSIYLPGANINKYPLPDTNTKTTEYKNKPEIYYPKYGQVM
jgi:hypothetical protein